MLLSKMFALSLPKYTLVHNTEHTSVSRTSEREKTHRHRQERRLKWTLEVTQADLFYPHPQGYVQSSISWFKVPSGQVLNIYETKILWAFEQPVLVFDHPH